MAVTVGQSDVAWATAVAVLPPTDTKSAYGSFQNDMYYGMGAANEQRFATLQGLLRDGKWHNTMDLEGVSVAVEGNRFALSRPVQTALFPLSRIIPPK